MTGTVTTPLTLNPALDLKSQPVLYNPLITLTPTIILHTQPISNPTLYPKL